MTLIWLTITQLCCRFGSLRREGEKNVSKYSWRFLFSRPPIIRLFLFPSLVWVKGFARSSVRWTVVEQFREGFVPPLWGGLGRGLSLLLVTLILHHRFGGNGRGRFCGVRLLSVRSGSGDGSPCLTRGTKGQSTKYKNCTKQRNHPRFRYMLSHRSIQFG